MKSIDLNSDMGELPELLADGTQERIMQVVSSVNIACGAHAGDDATITATLIAAKKHGLTIGAHPSYPDRANFGRKAMPLTEAALADSVFTQIQHLADLAKAAGVELFHVKPHGALYHEISKGDSIADAFFDGISRFSSDLAIVGFAGSQGLHLAAHRGFRTAAEAFMDRAYEPDGTLRARSTPGSLLAPDMALAQALQIVQHQQVTTTAGTLIPLNAQLLCIHSDTPNSATAALQAATTLHAANITITPWSTPPSVPLNSEI